MTRVGNPGFRVVDAVISCYPSRIAGVWNEGSAGAHAGYGPESWTLLGDDHVPVEPVERFLAYLAAIEKSPNTLKAYAHDLKDWFTYLAGRELDWQAVTIEDVAGFVAWLRLPPAARDGRVAVLPTVGHHCSESSVNRKLAALTSFCEFHARHGVKLAGLLITMPARGSPRRRVGDVLQAVPAPRHQERPAAAPHDQAEDVQALVPKVLTAVEVQTILDACDHLRDRLLFALLLDTGVRIGEALGLRHEDLDIAGRTLSHLLGDLVSPDQYSMVSYYRAELGLPEMGLVGRQLWEQSGLKPTDIQTAVLYDHFTPFTLIQLEELGFCGKGEAKDFIADGAIEVGGRLPINTHGGQLGEAYIHGMNGIAEGVRQLRGSSVNPVQDVEHVLVTAGTGVPTSGLILG